MRAFVPELTRLPRRRVLTVTSIGNPKRVSQRCVNALLGTAYAAKFEVYAPAKKTMAVGRLACRWVNAMKAPVSKWEARWGLEVSPFVTGRKLPQTDPRTRVKVANWDYGTVAQVLHRGPYSAEWPSIERLHRFIKEKGYRIVGPHEEEYLTRPDVKVPRTIIRYRVKKLSARKGR